MTEEQREQILAQLPAWWAGELSDEAVKTLQAQFRANPELQAEADTLQGLWDELGELAPPEPSPTMGVRFRATMQGYLDGKRKPQTAAGLWAGWRIRLPALAAAALLVFGFVFGYGYRGRVEDANRVSELEQQVESMTQLVAMALLNDRSPSGRIHAMQWAVRSRPTEDLVSALVGALNYDENLNVRLEAVSALESMMAVRREADSALENSAYDQKVRGHLVAAMSRQTSPLVQVALIDLYVHLRESNAEPTLQDLAGNATVHAVVRERASEGLHELRNF